MTHTEAVLDRLRTEEQMAINAGDKPILARSFRLAIQEIERLVSDARRLDFLETWSKRSRTGVSVEWSPEESFRVMTCHKVDRGQPNLRQAIDAAIGIRAPLPSQYESPGAAPSAEQQSDAGTSQRLPGQRPGPGGAITSQHVAEEGTKS